MLPLWNTQSSNMLDPILNLSNKKLSSADKFSLVDRFVPEMIKKDLFKNKLDFQQGDEKVGNQVVLNESLRKKQQKKVYNKLLSNTLKKDKLFDKKLNNYQPKNLKNGYLMGFLPNVNSLGQEQAVRCIPKHPYKILDAPRLKDDFYTSLLDWSKDDLISVVLDNAVYIWSGKGFQAQKFTQGHISCIRWGKGLTIGQQTGRIRILDVQKKKQTNRFKTHIGRVGTIDTYNNLIASGSKDSEVLIWDVRSHQPVSRFQGHKQEVCGLKWSFDGSMLASGGNDNIVNVWSPRMNRATHKFTEHTAAVKALAWSPHKHCLLATGGGSTDKTIKLWNVHEDTCIKSIETGSQVCNMLFSSTVDELISTHGYSLNSIAVWKVKNMQKIATLQGHSFRVLYLAKSPDQQTILTGSGDQTLRFWKVFPSSKSEQSSMSTLQTKNYLIR